VFVVGDIFSLVVQALGGAMAASESEDLVKANKGARVMVGGVLIQMGTFVHTIHPLRLNI
jgi:hypothetical protein